jgi:RNA polymerase sigma-70 factor (ECF subfamily)
LIENSALKTIKHWLSRKNEISIVDNYDFARLYDQNYMDVFRYVYGLSGGTQQDAEDITAETFMRAWTNRHRFSGTDQAALGWLLHIARNLAIDTSRRKRVRAVDDSVEIETLLDANALPEVDLIAREQTTRLWEMLRSLPAETREILVLRYMLGWQVNRIAVHLNMKENNVSVNIRRTLSRLQHDWNQLQGE